MLRSYTFRFKSILFVCVLFFAVTHCKKKGGGNSDQLLDDSDSYIDQNSNNNSNTGNNPYPNGNTGSSTTSTTTIGSIPVNCGNGFIDSNEACDGMQIPENTSCESQGFNGGKIGCTPYCQIKTSSCTNTSDINTGLSLNGINDFIAVLPKEENFDFPNGFTVEMWVQPLSNPDCDEKENFRILVSGGDEKFLFSFNDNRRKTFTFQTEKPDPSDAQKIITENRIISDTSELKLRNWNHLAISYNSQSGMLIIFTNGNITAQVPFEAQAVSKIPFFSFGGIFGKTEICPAQNGSLHAIFDEIRIWQSALSKEDIQKNMYSELAGTENGLMLSLSFNDFQSGSLPATNSSNFDIIIIGEPQPALANWNTCNNGYLETYEQCDNDQMSNNTCTASGFLSGAIACDTACFYNTSSCINSHPDIIGWYTFDNDSKNLSTVFDQSSFAHDGVLTHQKIENSHVNARFGLGLNITQSEDTVEIPSSNAFSQLSELSIEAWIFPRALKEAGIVVKADNASNHLDYGLDISAAGKIQVSFNGQNGQAGTSVSSGDSVFVKADTWNHIAFTWKQIDPNPPQDTANESKNVVLYLNGMKAGEGIIRGPLAGSSSALFLGQNRYKTPQFFNGIIDDIKLFKKVRTEKEICMDSGGNWAEAETTCSFENHVLFFDGDNDYISGEFKTPPAIDKQASYELWFKAFPSNTEQILLDTTGITLSINAGGKIHALLKFEKIEENESLTKTLLSSFSMRDNQWHHVAITTDGQTASLYIDGSAHDTDSVPDSKLLAPENKIFVIGSDGKIRFYHGLLDEIRIWNTFKSQKEILSSMHISSKGNEPDLAGYYPLHEAKGIIIQDLSNNKNDAKLGNADQVNQQQPLWFIDQSLAR